MNAFVSVESTRSSNPILDQGTLVSYILPYATTLELTGRQTGIVLSRGEYNRSSPRPCICPIIYGESSINEAWGIKIPTESSLASYLRPDLASFIGVAYGQVQPVRRTEDHLPCTFSEELIQRASKQFIDIISPAFEKFAQRGHGFLAHGEIGWSEKFPRAYEDRSDSAPIMNLTPPQIYKQTGMALVVRGYSHLEKYRPRHHIAVGASRWFDTAFFSVTDIRVLPTRDALDRRSGCKSFCVGERALKGFSKKEHGTLDSDAYAEIVARYTAPIGCLPPHVTVARKNLIQHSRR